MGKIVGGKLKVFPEDANAHRKIQNFISVKKLKSHTYEMAGEKQFKTVIRGLPSDFDVDEIIQELGTHNITPEYVSVMRNRKQNKNMPLFLVVSRKCPANQAIFQVTSIGYYKIKVEPLDKNSMPAQCYRCQLFYHHSRFCNREPKCLKCSQSHLTRDCTKKPDAPAKCANCGGPHPANFSRRIEEFLCDEDPDIIGIQETHLGPADSFKLPNYICHRSDRLSHRGGGTSIFVRNSLRHHVVSFNTSTFENTTVRIELGNNTHLTLSCIYKPPRNHINTSELDAILNASPKVMLFGDFNAHHPCWNSGRPNTHGNTLYNWASAHALEIMAPTAPTYYAARGTCSILDIAFAKNLILEDINSVNDLSSDHNPVLIDLALNNSLPKNLRTLKSTNWIKFQEIVFNSIPGNPIIDTNNIDNAINNFTGMITSAISATTVTKVISTPHLRLPHRIRELIKIKNRFPCKKPTTIPPLAGRNGILYSDDEKAEEFKNNLEATFQENAEPYNDKIIELVESETSDFLANSSRQVPPLTSPAEISKIISKLQNKKASGPDNIPNYALKLLPLNAITHLTKIINTCLKHRFFPSLWKSANVIMLPKPNQNHKLAQNYRPISLLCTTAKIYEKIILNRIKQHCDTINCIPPEQCGFRNNHSTTHQLIRVTNIINEGYTYKFFTVGVFLDVKRAFDKMWHDWLIYKMIKLNFPEYLVKKLYTIFSKTGRSESKLILTYRTRAFQRQDVLRGLVSRPTYTIFTLMIFPIIPVSVCLFADDAAVLAQGANLNYTQCTLQRYLHTLESWLTDWRIAINVDKTQAIVFRKHRRNLIPKTLSLFDEDIKWINVVRYLGLFLDSSLTYRQHTKYICDKFWAKIHLSISLIGRSPLSLKNKVLLYKQVLRPVLTYAAPVWGAAAPTTIKKVQTMQNKILRIMTNAPWYIRHSVLHHDLKRPYWGLHHQTLT
ncbi:RNA-directed DNA polymerase from mobile element jockey [Trichonephila clavipes]|nr:RNA-directed DNA polymerase from mobile element jockey [Trichonephila clavipes]